MRPAVVKVKIGLKTVWSYLIYHIFQYYVNYQDEFKRYFWKLEQDFWSTGKFLTNTILCQTSNYQILKYYPLIIYQLKKSNLSLQYSQTETYLH